MIDTIEALDAWCPPTLRPVGLGRTRLAWSMIAVESQSTRSCTSRRISVPVSLVRSGAGLLTASWTSLGRNVSASPAELVRLHN